MTDLFDTNDDWADLGDHDTTTPARPQQQPLHRQGDPLPPATPHPRPNGETYNPRRVGPHQDIALLQAAQHGQEHVLFYGPPGTGKTAVVESAFAHTTNDGRPGFETLDGTNNIQDSDFVGTFIQNPDTGKYQWINGVLISSIIRDVPLFIDEIAMIEPRVLSIMYPLMDGRGVLRVPSNPALGEFTVGKNWFVMAAYNPDVPGATISDALRDRFSHHIEANSDFDLAREVMGVHPKLVEAARELEKLRRDGTINWSPQLRSLKDFVRLEGKYGTPYAINNLVAKAPLDDRGAIADELKKVGYRPRALGLGERYDC